MSAKGIFIGNLTRDAVKNDINGVTLLTGSVAVRTYSRDEKGEYITDYYDFATRRNIDYLSGALKKGVKVQVIGDLKQRSYKDKQGNDRFSMQINQAEVDVLVRPASATTAATTAEDDDDDELPL